MNLQYVSRFSIIFIFFILIFKIFNIILYVFFSILWKFFIEIYSKVGVQLYVWKHPATNKVVFSYRGTFSDNDDYENYIWFGEQYAFHLPDSSVEYWEKFGNKKSELEKRSK